MTISTTQTAILAAAADHPQGQIHWFPDNVKGGARAKVLGSLSTAGLISQKSSDAMFSLTEQGYAAIGKEVPACPPETPAAPEPRLRSNTKQAEIIRLLSRPQGATLEDLTIATGWLKHTVRGAMSQLSKKLSLTIASQKPDGGIRVYHIS
ncbi:MAG: hypothetical protein RJA63_3901 [Pseudomonadota bacterium]|jgi:hypothetical protein